MKKIIKYLFIAVIAVLIAQTIMNKFFDDRPIKFESYKTAQYFEEAMRDNFPAGTNMDEAKTIMEQSGARCIQKISDESVYPFKYPGARHIMTCYYRAYFFSDDPVIDYSIILQADESRQILYVGAMRTGGFWVI